MKIGLKERQTDGDISRGFLSVVRIRKTNKRKEECWVFSRLSRCEEDETTNQRKRYSQVEKDSVRKETRM